MSIEVQNNNVSLNNLNSDGTRPSSSNFTTQSIVLSAQKTYTGTTDASLPAGELVVVTQGSTGFTKFDGTNISNLLGDSMGIVAVPTSDGLVNNTVYTVYKINSLIKGSDLALTLTANNGVALVAGQHYFADQHVLKPTMGAGGVVLDPSERSAMVGKASVDNANIYEVFSEEIYAG